MSTINTQITFNADQINRIIALLKNQNLFDADTGEIIKTLDQSVASVGKTLQIRSHAFA